MKEEFLKFHGKELNKKSGIFDKVTDCIIPRINEDLFPRPIIHYLVRTRSYIRLRNMNLKKSKIF